MSETKITPSEIAASLISGWVSYPNVIPTRASEDDPTYVLTFAGVDLTSIMSVGMKVKFTQNGATVYGIITALSFSTDTTMTLYCGTDYDVSDTATYAISDFYYSPHKAPFGFPMSPTKWTVSITDSTNRVQSNPTVGTWYNLGSLSINIPIGCWNVFRKTYVVGFAGSSQAFGIYTTLSTGNSTESDTSFTGLSYASTLETLANVHITEKFLTLTSKTTYYINSKIGLSGATGLNNNNAAIPLIVRAVCAYL